MKLKVDTISSRRIYKGKTLDFFVDRIRINQVPAVREYISYPQASGVIPVLPDGRIIMVEQYRYTNRTFSLEIPAGKKEKDESLLACAHRELTEETGYKSGKMKKLFSYYPAISYSTEHLFIYLATDLSKTRQAPDRDEFLKLHILTLAQVLRHIQKNRIKDSKTILSMLHYAYFTGKGRNKKEHESI